MMEVVASTRAAAAVVPGGRPRFIPSSNNNSERLTVSSSRTSGTGTMTRSTSSQLSHHQHNNSPPGTYNNRGSVSNGQLLGSPPSAADTTIRDKTKLLQLAEKVHTRKASNGSNINNGTSSTTPNYAKSFRAITSAVVLGSAGGRNKQEVEGTPKVRRTNSTMLSSTSSSCPPPPTRKMENYKNPKLYASFSSKSCSKLTKALIKSDPAKTNIEHLVNYKVSPPNKPESGKRGSGGAANQSHNFLNGKRSPSENAENGHHHHNGSSGGGLSSFITPLKALHASFHERSSKLGQTRSKLFSHHHNNNHNRDISGSNVKLLFGTQENLHSASSSSPSGSSRTGCGSGSNSSSSSAEDILAAEIISQSESNKHSRSNNKISSSSSSPHRRAATAVTSSSTNNHKNAPTCGSLSLSLSTKSNGAISNNKISPTTTVCDVGVLPVPPDFLGGYINEKEGSSRSSNGCISKDESNYSGYRANLNHNDNYHFTSSNHINGSNDKRDLPHDTSMIKGFQNEHEDEKIQANKNGLSTPDILLGGCLDVNRTDSHGPSYYNDNKDDTQHYHQQRQRPSISKDVSQKRKNIVVRMSYCDDNGDIVDDLYRDENKDVFDICRGDDNGGLLKVVEEDVDGLANGIWSTSPIMVSAVTPKTKHQSFFSSALNKSDDCNNESVLPTFSSFLASDKRNNVNNGPCNGTGNSLRTFRPKTGASVVPRGVVVPPPRTSSILSSTVSNSSIIKPPLPSSKESSNLQRNSQLILGGGEHEAEQNQKDCLEATGSPTWPQIKTYSGIEQQGGATTVPNFKESSSHAFSNCNNNNYGGAGINISNQKDEQTHEFNGNRVGEGGERSKRGVFIEAETSLGPSTISLQQKKGMVADRPQTALLSDEYAKYLGYNYHKNENDFGLSKEEATEDKDSSENDDVFYADGKKVVNGENNMTMLAITTTTPAKNNGTRNLTSIMKPQNGKCRENGKKLVQHSVSFRGTLMAANDNVGESLRQRNQFKNDDNELKRSVKSNYLTTTGVDSNSNAGGILNDGHHENNNDDDNKTCSRLARLAENVNDFDRKRSRSLPKSFMSVRNGLRSVLPSQWVRDGQGFERLNENYQQPEQPTCPEVKDEEHEIAPSSLSSAFSSGSSSPQERFQPNHPLNQQHSESLQSSATTAASSEDQLKMRWNRLGSGSSSSSFSADRRPKSFDYAQRKAWMKLYRDMEVSQASGISNNPSSLGASNSNPRLSRPITKGSITHLHLKEPTSTSQESNLDGGGGADYEVGDDKNSTTMMRSSAADISSTSPSLFKRFSKTFSLRFGSGSNVSKQQQYQHQHPHYSGGGDNRKGKKGAIGSSPDLFNTRLELDVTRDKVNGKMRKTNVKSVRGDKCQSGDSGIGMDDQQDHHHHRQISNLRRIRSDYISPTAAASASSALGIPPPSSSTATSSSSYASRATANGSTLAKLSLVEIPDHSWDENGSSSSPNEGSGTNSDTTSYEEMVDSKLDGDDGFSSSDEGHNHHSHNKNHDQPPEYYHSLPHRRNNKRRLKEKSSSNSCGDTPQEDNSIRGKVVREIIHTEQNYVKTLNDIVQGFLNPCRARNDLFSSRTVQNIFSNIEEILRLHVKFLEALKSKVEPTFVSNSNIGEVFTSWADKFGLYSEYCCNNPISVATVRSLVQYQQYAEFFEACRRLQMMDKLPLHGFLLRPIQRICQYHLQLNELLKHTEESHTDHKSVVEALETMKSVATRINDTQRQFESLQEIIKFQNSIDGWEGPNLVDRNAVILRKGELVKVTHGRKQKEVFVAILNKDLIYCKKDFMKKSGYVYDGRIDLNLRMWINIDSNEEDDFFGMVHNSWRIYSPERRTWILFTAPSPTEKRKWISALEKAKEDIFVDPKLREMAVVTTALAESEIMSNGNSQGHHSNTLPKSSKKAKGKHLSVQKVDSDAMLIEVGKLKRSTVYSNSTPSQREGSSKFYV